MSTDPDPIQMTREEHTISGGRRLFRYRFVVADAEPSPEPPEGNLGTEEPEKAE